MRQTWCSLIGCLIGCMLYAGTMLASPYDGLIGATAKRYDIEPALVKAMIACESRFDPQAVSPRGAQGLMQLMPATQATLGVTDAFDPQRNIDAGVRYLTLLRETFGMHRDLLLAAYNAGPQAVIDVGYAVPAIAETQHYIACVEAARQIYMAAGFNAISVGVPMHVAGSEGPANLVVEPLYWSRSEGVTGQRLLLHVKAWNVSADIAHGVVSLTYPTALLSLLALQTTPQATTVQVPGVQALEQSYQVMQGDWPSWSSGQQRQAVLAVSPRQDRDVALHLSVLLFNHDRADVKERWSTMVRIPVHGRKENAHR